LNDLETITKLKTGR